MKNASVGLVVILGIVGLLVALCLLNGFMLSYMWAWFIVPLGAPPIGVLHAIGIGILVSVLTSEASPGGQDEDAIQKMLGKLFAKLAVFGIAWAVSFGVAA